MPNYWAPAQIPAGVIHAPGLLPRVMNDEHRHSPYRACQCCLPHPNSVGTLN